MSSAIRSDGDITSFAVREGSTTSATYHIPWPLISTLRDLDSIWMMMLLWKHPLRRVQKVHAHIICYRTVMYDIYSGPIQLSPRILQGNGAGAWGVPHIFGGGFAFYHPREGYVTEDFACSFPTRHRLRIHKRVPTATYIRSKLSRKGLFTPHQCTRPH